MLEISRKIISLIDRQGRRRLLLVFFSMVASGLSEMFGVAAILPFLRLAADPSQLGDFPYLLEFFSWLHISENRLIVVGMGVLVLFFILFAFLMRTGSMYLIARFSHGQNHSISSRLMASYLAQPYEWYLHKNSANLGVSVLSEVDRIVGEGLIPLMRLLSQVISIFFLTILLLVVEPVAALGAALFVGSAYFGVFQFVRHRLSRISLTRAAANIERYRISQEAFGGVKDVKLLRAEQAYQKRYDKYSRQLARAASTGQMIGELPRYFLEALAFGGMVALVITLMLTGSGNLADHIPTLGLFAVAGFKMFPAIQIIYHSMTQIRMVESMLDNVYNGMRQSEFEHSATETEPHQRLNLNRDLEIRNLTFSFKGENRSVLEGLNLCISANTTVALVGGSGAGKTTTVDLILGLLTPGAGEIRIDGKPVDSQNISSWQRNVGYVPQAIFLTDDSIAANIAFGVPPEQIDMAAVARASRLAKLHDFVVTELPQGYDTEVGERGVRLSGGQRQRIGIARALYRDPDVLVFDEATSALDNLTERAVMEAVNNLGRQKTIIMIAHRLSTVRNCDKIFLLEKGRLVAEGTYDELVATNETFRRMAQG